jgi:fatty acid desaturase
LLDFGIFSRHFFENVLDIPSLSFTRDHRSTETIMTDARCAAEIRIGDGAPPFAESLPESLPGDYPSLLRHLKAKGCLNKQAGYYTGKMLLNLALLALCVAVLASHPSTGLLVLDALFLGFVYVQIGMVVHDLGHHQVYRDPWTNDLLGTLHYNLLLGISYRYWLKKHTAHHRHPNRLDKDPDIYLPFAYSAEQAHRASGLHRFLIRYQAFFFLPVISLGLYSLHYLSILFLLRRAPRGQLLLEALLLPLHYLLYFGLVYFLLPPWQAALFVLVHHAGCGLYLGLVFATNHMGMPILDTDAKTPHVYRQVATSRNIKAHPVANYLFGPLSCQIEHHLCPNIPLNKLREAQTIVQPFCARWSIPYHETGAFEAFREVLQHLHRISKSVRKMSD